ncbi:hypothetical protein [Streptomyces morookaense]|uniref:Uncharacterized protein n=1 Tax=Streptomyces morookaense TaxID=1970 RepID=A0A7Y7B6T6_STRMO|nr:hypothetical protein [Streptomyces morookaense]NVK80037.1 hypothetical protein [Streptomyces morookaense]GHF41721.1 hypothetical protein GCM10010359_50500 [Streptomyces morookaense]
MSIPSTLGGDGQNSFNSFWLFRREGAGVQEAVDSMAAMAVERLRRFISAREEILKGPLGEREDVRDYLWTLAVHVGGHQEYMRTSSRYLGVAIGPGAITLTEITGKFTPDE